MDAERECVDHLNASGVGAAAYYDVPRGRPDGPPSLDRFLVVERTGGPRGEGRTSRPMVDVQCWAPTRREAALLAEAVADAMCAMPAASDDVAHVSVTSTFRDTDLESGTPRYHVVCEIYSNR